MGIGGASLYHSFGDKRALFARALQRYLDFSARRRLSQLDSAEDALAALHGFFADLLKASLSDRRGCLLINSALELAPHDEGLARDIRDALTEIESGFRRAVQRAQQQGTVPMVESEVEIARRLLSAVVSLRVLARVSNDEELLSSIVRHSLPPAS